MNKDLLLDNPIPCLIPKLLSSSIDREEVTTWKFLPGNRGQGRAKLLPEQAAQATGLETQDRWQIHGARWENYPNTNGSHKAQCRPICPPPLNSRPETSEHQEDEQQIIVLALALNPRQPSGPSVNLGALK